MNTDIIHPLVESILRSPLGYDWSLQGLGMLRLYLRPDLRLHVWSKSHAYPNVSTIHDHPWDFLSYVVAGYIHNQKYTLSLRAERRSHMCQTIMCGPGGGATNDSLCRVTLVALPPERHNAGSTYKQLASEIHESIPEDGAVTIVHKFVPEDGDGDHAKVFWPAGREWVSARPRRASADEVLTITQNSLQRWFC